MKKALVWVVLIFLFFLLVFFIKKNNAEATTEYCKIGADPVNPGLLFEGEKIYKLPRDLPARIKGGSGKISDCTLRAGEEMVISETANGNWRIVRIYSCGNPVLSEAYAEAPQGQRQALQPAPSPPLPPQQQYSQPFPAPAPQQAPTTLSQTTNVMVQAPPSAPTGPPMNVSYYGNGGQGSYSPNRAYDDYYNGGNSDYGNGGGNYGYGAGPRLLESAMGIAGAVIIADKFSRRRPEVEIHDSFNKNISVDSSRRRDFRVDDNRRDRRDRRDGGNGDSAYSNYHRSDSGSSYSGNRGTKYCPPTYRNTNTGNARQDYINQTVRGNAGRGAGGSPRQNYIGQTIRGQSPRRR